MMDDGHDDAARKGRASGPRKAPRSPPRPLDDARLQALALHYVARYATTRARLMAYLARKLKARGWEGAAPPDLAGIAARMASLGYVDDAAWASMKAREMTTRGLGPRRVAQALHAAGVAPPAESFDNPLAAALRHAEKKRLGPFARHPATDPASRRRALAAMLRAGHAMDIARQVLAAPDAEAARALLED